MKVVHLIDHMGLGGAQMILLDFIEAQPSQIDSVLLTLRNRMLPSTGERLALADVQLRNLGLSKWDPIGFFKLRSELARERPDVLHTYLDYSNSLGVAAAQSLGKSRPLIVRNIDNDPHLHYCPVLRLVARQVGPLTDAMIAISPSLRDAAERSFGPGPRMTRVIPPAIDLQRFDVANIDPGTVRRLRADARQVIGSVGRLTSQKGHATLLEAFKLVRAHESDTRLLIVGDGPQRKALGSMARRLGVRSSVDFLGYRSDMPTVYAAMDVLALPSLHEGFGIVFLEAMAMGVPVIGTQVVGSIDAIREGVTGLLVPPKNPRALADRILHLLREQELRDVLVENGKTWVRNRSSRESRASEVVDLYKELVKSP